MRKLQANPNDADALANMYEAQKMMASWASSKNKPGQFVGSTGATVLSKHELNLGLQCWAKPEMFDKAKKVEGGFGEFMLKKMGWIDGEGLGKHKSGEVSTAPPPHFSFSSLLLIPPPRSFSSLLLLTSPPHSSPIPR